MLKPSPTSNLNKKEGFQKDRTFRELSTQKNPEDEWISLAWIDRLKKNLNERGGIWYVGATGLFIGTSQN